MKRVVLAYSGGLDTSVAVRWIREEWGYEVIDGPRSLVWPQAANRMDAVRALLVDLVEEAG